MPRKNTLASNFPQAVLQQIEWLAQNIVIARKRRGESQAQWAKKLGISQPTMARIERGDPSVAMASYVMCMWLINQAHGLADLIAPQNDLAALEKEVTKVQQHPRTTNQQTRQQAHHPAKTINHYQPHPPHSNSLQTMESIANLSQHSRLAATDPRRDDRPPLKNATKRSHPASSSAAAGLAALMAKPSPQKP